MITILNSISIVHSVGVHPISAAGAGGRNGVYWNQAGFFRTLPEELVGKGVRGDREGQFFLDLMGGGMPETFRVDTAVAAR